MLAEPLKDVTERLSCSRNPKCSSKDMDLDWHPFPNIHFSVPQAANRVSCTLNAMEMTVGYGCTLAIAGKAPDR